MHNKVNVAVCIVYYPYKTSTAKYYNLQLLIFFFKKYTFCFLCTSCILVYYVSVINTIYMYNIVIKTNTHYCLQCFILYNTYCDAFAVL